jgi:PPM family protein phosphatase
MNSHTAAGPERAAGRDLTGGVAHPVPVGPSSSGAAPACDASGATDRGRRRRNNEDAFAVVPLAHPPGALLLAVADGVGGARGGEVASRLAVDTLVGALSARPMADDQTPSRALERAVQRAAAALRQVAHERREMRGLGTTLTAALVIWPRLWVAHVGDTRAYLWRGGRLARLTNDHTMAERLREEGVLAPGDDGGRWESVLWNALGGAAEDVPQVELRHASLSSGDAILLCSDGLTRHLDDRELGRRLNEGRPAEELCQALVDDANRAGGADNITAVVARLGASGPPGLA